MYWENKVYAQGRQINRWPYTEVVSRVLRASGDERRDTAHVLEIGCGTGNNLRFLVEEGFMAYGIDTSPTAIENARRLLAPLDGSATLAVGDITELPWPNQSFDLVVDRAALVHNTPARIRLALQEAHRTLKSGGKLISIGLKTEAHPDLVFGHRQESGAWSEFSQGKFKGLGETSFLSVEEARDLFSVFEAVSIELLSRSTHDGHILDQDFLIEAVRP